jgi:DNA-binding winged helix-turn-helix (wHTH) protein
MADHKPACKYRFGVFEADETVGELRRQGVRVKLNAQPFQVLCLLLARAGELLTRDEIARELWPDGTFVDYEHGVNSAMNRIREALGDSAANPRFVETLARRGYRFVAPVERMGEAAVVVQAPVTPEPALQDGGLLGGILATPDDLPKTSHQTVLTLFVLFQGMYLAFYVGALANLAEIEELFSGLDHPLLALRVMVVSAGILIPARAFLICAVLFRAPGIRAKLLRIWPALLAADLLWSLAPFLLLHHFSVGLALACTALLVYSPFAQRALVLMGAGGEPSAV